MAHRALMAHIPPIRRIGRLRRTFHPHGDLSLRPGRLAGDSVDLHQFEVDVAPRERHQLGPAKTGAAAQNHHRPLSELQF
jgi:hypothetical protein